MTPLDVFEPEGEPIHPYDLYDMLNASTLEDILILRSNPPAETEADYLRNIHKIGSVIEWDGKRYFETTDVPFKSKNF